jgi:hypothetical protein
MQIAQKITKLAHPIRASYKKAEFGDLLLFFFILAVFRQYFWPVRSNLLAWVMTFSVALPLWYFGLKRKEEPLPEEGLSYPFYLIVALPLFVIYASRVVFPDFSFDVLNYHILAGETSLRGWPYSGSRYVPRLNPTSDMITGIYRHLLGYRLGTIVNYLTLIWVATILVKFLRPYLKRPWVIYLAVLLILLTETILFEINNYMVDLLALPLLLQATYLVLDDKEPKTIGYRQFFIAFLLGISVVLKLTNVFFVIPIMLIWAQRLLAARVKVRPVLLPLVLLAFISPAIPDSVHLYLKGNVVVPFLDTAVKSPLAFTQIKEPRWGPIGLQQSVIWPALLYSKAQRVAELPVYAGKIPLGFVLAFFFLPFKRIDRNIRALCLIMIVGALLWSLVSGYTRYTAYLEVISGILVIYLSRFIFENFHIRNFPRLALSLMPWVGLALLSVFSLSYLSQYEWSMRPTAFAYPRPALSESRFLFRDYSLKSLLPPEKAARFEEVEIWVRSVPQTSAFEALLKPEAAAIGLPSSWTLESKSKFDKEVHALGNKRMFSLTYAWQLKPTADFIAQGGLGIGKITYVSLPFYSYQTVYKLTLIEVLPEPASGSKTEPLVLNLAADPLPYEGFRASIVSPSLPTRLTPGSTTTVSVTVKNTSSVSWPGQGGTDEAYTIKLGNHWLDSNGNILIMDDNRAALPFELKPGDEVELSLTIRAPSNPGTYVLEMDMVQEQFVWFSSLGSKTLRANIKVE